jgi:hypothetical protein
MGNRWNIVRYKEISYKGEEFIIKNGREPWFIFF